jgi:hypothetical protein
MALVGLMNANASRANRIENMIVSGYRPAYAWIYLWAVFKNIVQLKSD